MTDPKHLNSSVYCNTISILNKLFLTFYLSKSPENNITRPKKY